MLIKILLLTQQFKIHTPSLDVYNCFLVSDITNTDAELLCKHAAAISLFPDPLYFMVFNPSMCCKKYTGTWKLIQVHL